MGSSDTCPIDRRIGRHGLIRCDAQAYGNQLIAHLGGYLLATLLLMSTVGLLGCNDSLIEAEDALGDTAQRVEANLLPPLLEESGLALRNILNVFPLFVEVCGTPVGEMGEFMSTMPELQRAQQLVGDVFTLHESNGTWRASWRDVVLGDQDGQVDSGLDAPEVDLTLTVRFQSQALGIIQAIPFSLASATAVSTVKEPATAPACTADTPAGFFLFQDRVSGLWTLSWCATESITGFTGMVSGSAISRVMRGLTNDAERTVSTLVLNNATTELTFRETTEPLESNGFRFFVRPGELIRLRLGLGPTADNTQPINREQIVLGTDQRVPANLNISDFRLVSSAPIVAAGAPPFTSGVDLGTFVWVDSDNNQCPSGQDEQWRLRFSTPRTSTRFTGTFRTANDSETTRLAVTAIGACPAPSIEENTTAAGYDCTVQDATPSGYDICVTAPTRVTVTAFTDQVRDPSLVSIGAAASRPSSQDPDTIFYDLEMEELGSRRKFTIQNTPLTLHGDDGEVNNTALLSGQLSRDPLCQFPADPEKQRLRLTGRVEYSTERFEGSIADLDDVEFTDTGGIGVVGRERLPDRSRIILRTRQDGEAVEITVPMEDVVEQNGQVMSLIDVDLRINLVQFLFPDRSVSVTSK